MHLLHGG